MNCIECNKEIEIARSTKKYCGPTCRSRAYRCNAKDKDATLTPNATLRGATLSIPNATLSIPDVRVSTPDVRVTDEQLKHVLDTMDTTLHINERRNAGAKALGYLNYKNMYYMLPDADKKLKDEYNLDAPK